MVLDVSQKNLDQPIEEVLSAQRDPDQSGGITIVEQLDEEAQRKLEVIQSQLFAMRSRHPWRKAARSAWV
jgi:hypothetical protein